MALLDGLVAEQCAKGMTEDVSPLMELLLDIEGIEVVQIQMYKVYVRKSAIFEWDEIDPEIKRRFLIHIPFACGQEEVIHERQFADAWKEPTADPVQQEPGNANGTIILP